MDGDLPNVGTDLSQEEIGDPKVGTAVTNGSSATSDANGTNGLAPNGGAAASPVPLRRARRQQLPELRDAKTEAADVVVLAFGSHAFRYGRAVDTTPRKVLSLVAFPRRAESDAARPPVRPVWTRAIVAENEADRTAFEQERTKIAEELDLDSRRIGGGKPIPWDVEVEVVTARTKDIAKEALAKEGHGKILVGRDAHALLREARAANAYDIVAPMWDGKLVFGASSAADGLVRAALDELLRHVARELGITPEAREEGEGTTEKKAPNGDSAKEANGVGEDDVVVDEAKADNEKEAEKSKEREKYAYRQVAIVVPDASDRRDVAEIVDAIFRVDELRAGAVFVHQSSVSCALGAGLATCAVVDIGHAATTVACVEEGSICGDSRVHLNYGAHHMRAVFAQLLRGSQPFMQTMAGALKGDEAAGNVVEEDEGRDAYDMAVISARAFEQVCGFRAEDNDRLLIASAVAPAGDVLRVKIGLGMRALPAYGLAYPELLLTGSRVAGYAVEIRQRAQYERNSDDDNFLDDLYADMRRSATATAALPIGRFANEPSAEGNVPVAATAATEAVEAEPSAVREVLAMDASVVDAVIWAIGRAVRASAVVAQQPGRAPELHRRFLNAIVLSGGGASLDGIALALESRIKRGLQEKGLVVSDVTIIDGGKGKGDEELAAAAAVLRDHKGSSGVGQGDDTDTASLPWKGCAVMVEADAVKDYWVYKDDWDERNVRALRERVPFYW